MDYYPQKDDAWGNKQQEQKEDEMYFFFLLIFSKQDGRITLFLVLSLNYCVLSLAAEPICAVVFSLLMRVMTTWDSSLEFNPPRAAKHPEKLRKSAAGAMLPLERWKTHLYSEVKRRPFKSLKT